jgi:hypothetical protein
MKKSQLATREVKHILDYSLESPYHEKNGLLEFTEEFTPPKFFAI